MQLACPRWRNSVKRSACCSACSTSPRPKVVGSASGRSARSGFYGAYPPARGRGACVPVAVAPLGGGTSAVVPLARDGRPFRILIAEVLLQRSRGKTVATVYERLFARGRRPDALARARVDSIASVIRPLGLGAASGDTEEACRSGGEQRACRDSPDELEDLPRRRSIRGQRYARRRVREACPGRRWRERPGLSEVLRSRFGRPAASDGRAVGAGGGGHAATAGPRVELGGAGSGGIGVSPEGSEMRGVPLRPRCAWSLGVG